MSRLLLRRQRDSSEAGRVSRVSWKRREAEPQVVKRAKRVIWGTWRLEQSWRLDRSLLSTKLGLQGVPVSYLFLYLYLI